MSFMKARLILAFAMGLVALTAFAGSGPAWGASSESLAAAEQEVTAAKPEVATAQREMKVAKATVAPIEAEAAKAEQQVLDAQEQITDVEGEIEEERSGAAREVASAEKSYEDEKSSKSSTRTIGIVLLVLSVLSGVLLFVFARLGQWKPNTVSKVVAGAGLVVAAVIGVVLLASSSSPPAPTFSKQTEELAKAPTDPSAQPTAKLEAAQIKMASAESVAAPIEKEHKKLYEGFEAAQGNFEQAQADLTAAQQKESKAQNAIYRAEKSEREAVEKAEKAEREESEFREDATTIDYNQLIKNPDKYKGEKVVYEGQILQIQEEAGSGIMLLSVTDEGYGFWTNNIWVNFYEPIEAAEEDIITVYGKITGSEEYETQIGGSTFVPRMNADYIDE
jgi:hypothetical protein